MIKISCIIPTCNRQQYLTEAIQSVLKQSYAVSEIIVVDNGNTPAELPMDLKQKVSLYHFIPNAGAAQARNFGVGLSKGDYLAFLDDDDTWNENYILNVVKSLEEESVDCILGRIDKLYEGKVSHWKNPENHLNLDTLFIRNPGAGGSNIVISKKLFYQVGGYNPKLVTGEDKSLVIEIIRRNIPIKVLSNNNIIARINIPKDKQSLTNSNEIMAEGIFQFLKNYSKLMSLRQRWLNWKKLLTYKMKFKLSRLSLFFN